MDSSTDEEQIQSIHKMIKKGRKTNDLPIESKKTAQTNGTRKRKLNIIQQPVYPPVQSEIITKPNVPEKKPRKTKKKSPEEKVSKEKKPRKTKKKSPEEKVIKEKKPPKIRKTTKMVKLVNIAPRLVIEEDNIDKPEINIKTDELPELVPICI